MTDTTVSQKLPLFVGLPTVHNRGSYKSPQLSTDPEQMQREKILRSYLDKMMQITLQDGRTFTGQFCCIDYKGTFVLHHANVVSNTNATATYIGHVLIAKEHITKICVKEDKQA